MNQNDVLRTCVQLLDQARVPYMVTGSVASAYYGEGRSTLDTDIVIDAEWPAVRQFVESLPAEFYASEDAAREAVEQRRMFNIIHAPTSYKVDLIVRKDRPFSRVEFERRRPAVLEDVPATVASPEDVILAKLEWASKGDSERQLRDAANVAVAQHPNLEYGYMRQWAEELGLEDLFERILEYVQRYG